MRASGEKSHLVARSRASKSKLVLVRLVEALAAFGTTLELVKAGAAETFETTGIGPEITFNHWAAALSEWTPFAAASHIPNDGHNDELWFKPGGLRTGVRLRISARLLAQLRRRRRSVPAEPPPEVSPRSAILGPAPLHVPVPPWEDAALKRLPGFGAARPPLPENAASDNGVAVTPPDKPGPKPGSSGKARVAELADALLGNADTRPAPGRGCKTKLAKLIHEQLAAEGGKYEFESVKRTLYELKIEYRETG
jgi:hypothetical protein